MIASLTSMLKRVFTSPVLAALVVIGIACLLQMWCRGPSYQLPLLKRLEWTTYDWRVRLAAKQSAPVATNLGCVFISDESIAAVEHGSDLPYRFGMYWPRQVYGYLLRELTAQGAKAVAFGVLFPEQRSDHLPVKMPDGSQLGSDDFFAEQLHQAGNVILGADQRVSPHSLFCTNAWAVGDLSAQREMDGVLRRARAFHDLYLWHPLIQEAGRLQGWNLPLARIGREKITFPAGGAGGISLALDQEGRFSQAKLYEELTGQAPPVGAPTWSKPFTTLRAWQTGILLAALELKLDLPRARVEPKQGRIVLTGARGITRVIPLDNAGGFYVDWRMTINHPALTEESIESLLIQDAQRQRGHTNSLTNRFKDKLVIVGSTASGNDLSDVGATPLEQQTYLMSQHWNVANSILTDSLVRPSSLSVELLLICLLGGLASFCAWNLGFLRGSAGVLLLGCLYFAATVWLFLRWRYCLPVVVPLGAAAVMMPIRLLAKLAYPLAVAQRFFRRAGFKQTELLGEDVLLLTPAEGQTAGIAALWQEDATTIPDLILRAVKAQQRKAAPDLKLYLIYRRQAPVGNVVQSWRRQLGCEIIPLPEATLERAFASSDYERLLKEIEEPYLVRADPYAEFKPISDPIWFYGRSDLMERLPAALAQGQHVGLFGLRKVGKTSLSNQLRQRFAATPCVCLDCQGLTAKVENYFDAIYRELRAELHALRIRRLPKLHRITDADDFTRSFVALFERWQRAGHREPFLLILDEIDKFFPNPEVSGREEMLSEYVRVFRVLRSLAQTRQCLAVLVIAYRPTVNRQNVLTPRVGENPMFNSFQEHYLGFLSSADSETLVREIGLWKNIVWEEGAARAVFQYCGGHPLITRYFASHACRKGVLKHVTQERAAETASELQKTLRKNEIGNYYREGIWELLHDDERQVLARIVQGDGCSEQMIPEEWEEGLSNLERFGLVENQSGHLRVTAELFRVWLERRLGA